MPELPEVETTKRGIEPHILGKTIRSVVVRNASLRWPIPEDLASLASGQKITSISRRGKYILMGLASGDWLIWHLGMSGSMRITDPKEAIKAHDHVELIFNNQLALRFYDPRRFGSLLHSRAPYQHKLLANLGPEPLEAHFNADYLYKRSRKRSAAIKTFIMDSKVVVGVGNIYANEALFNSHIHPLKAAGKLSKAKYEVFVGEIKQVLARAIEQGGTTLKDFVGSDGQPGYFVQQLNVYGRGGQPCVRCNKPLTEKRLGQRTTVYCTQCQK
jgi:DNA-(apurinic or apyrimidinic site) lyase (EC 4.2.99.18)/Formamidopyrimidine-DNA glycosylase (EC 3.2.2.23)